MTARKPLWTQGGSTSAEEDRAFIAACFPITGVVAQTDLAVTQNGTPNMSVNVAAGRCVMPGTESATLQGRYVGWLDATLNVAIAASDPTNPRIDLIVAKTQDAQYSGATNAFSVVAVTGTPAGSPVAPATPNNAIVLAQISVAASSTTVLTAAITDVRVGAGDALPIVGASGVFPFPPVDGLGVYVNSGTQTEGPYFYNGTAWRLPWNMPWGYIGQVAITASSTASGGVTTVAGLSVTFTAVANRAYKITACGRNVTQVGAGTTDVILARGTTTIMDVLVSQAAGTAALGASSVVDTPGAGSVTYNFRTSTSATSAQVIAGAADPTVLFVEDMGATGAPA